MGRLLISFFLGFALASLCLVFPWRKKENVDHKNIPLQGLSLGFTFCLLLALKDPLFALLALLVALVGCADDVLGSAEKGFHGHFSALRKGKITSGIFKALSIFILSLIFSLVTAAPLPFLAAIFLSLSANTFNLLDCYPGRAGKLFLAVSFLRPVLAPLWIAYLPFFVLDLRKKAMLGDGGSNLLGIVIAGALLRLPIPFWTTLTVLLLWLHLYTEKHTLSDFIRAHRWLDWLDNFGVKIT